MKIPLITLAAVVATFAPIQPISAQESSGQPVEEPVPKEPGGKTKGAAPVTGKVESFDATTSQLKVKKGKKDVAFTVTGETKITGEGGAAAGAGDLKPGVRVNILAATDGTTAHQVKILPPKGAKKPEDGQGGGGDKNGKKKAKGKESDDTTAESNE